MGGRRLASACASALIVIATLLPAVASAQSRPDVGRYSGATRAATAASIALDQSDGGALFDSDRVILVRQDSFADGLAASYLAGVLDAPILLTATDALPDETASALEALDPRTVVVVGGQSAVSDDALDPLPEETQITRVAGSSRFDTAAQIARFTDGTAAHRPDTVLIASGESFPDALVAGPLAGAEGLPLLLTGRDELPSQTVDAIRDLGPGNAIVVGGTGVVSDGVRGQLEGLGVDVTRIGGTSRFDTSRLVAEYATRTYGWQPGHVVLATGGGFADALPAGAFAANSFSGPAPILLTGADALPAEVGAYLDGLDECAVFAVRAVGGELAVGDAVLGDVESRTTRPASCESTSVATPVVSMPSFSQDEPTEAVVTVTGTMAQPRSGLRQVVVGPTVRDERYAARLTPTGDGQVRWSVDVPFGTSGVQSVTVTALDGLGRERTATTNVFVDAPEDDELVIGYDVKLLAEADEDDVADVRGTGEVISFEDGDEPRWVRGDVIVPERYDGPVPEASRRRVDFVSHDGDMVHVHTSPALLTEVVINGDLSLTDEDASGFQADAVTYQGTTGVNIDTGFEFGGRFEQAVIPGVTARGEASFGGKVLFDLWVDWTWQGPRVDYARAAIEGTQRFDIEVEAGGEIGGNRQLFAPVSLGTIRFSINGFPVWVVPRATGVFYVHGSLSARVGFSQQSSLLLGYEYRDGAAQPLNTFSRSQSFTGGDGLDVAAGAEVGVTLDVEFRVYDVVGPRIRGDIYGKVSSDGQSYSARVGVRLSATGRIAVELGPARFTLLEFNLQLVEYEVEVRSGTPPTSPTDPPPPTNPDPDPDPQPDPDPDPQPDPDPDPQPDPDPVTPTPSPTINLSRGGAAPAGFWYSVTISGFPANTGVSLTCHDSVDPQGFYSQTLVTNSSGAASDSTLCYSADGPDHWVTGGGHQSNHVAW